jgi:hypothetical protein
MNEKQDFSRQGEYWYHYDAAAAAIPTTLQFQAAARTHSDVDRRAILAPQYTATSKISFLHPPVCSPRSSTTSSARIASSCHSLTIDPGV